MDLSAKAPLPNLRQRLLSVPVFVKILGIALGMTVVLGLGLLWQIHQSWHALLLRDLDQRGRVLADDLAQHRGEFTQAGRGSEFLKEFQHALTESPDAVYAIVEGQDGTVWAEARTPAVLQTGMVREVVRPLQNEPARLRVGMSTGRADYEVRWLTRRVAVMTLIISLLGLLAAWRVTRIIAHPIEELVTLTRAVKAGNYEAKAPLRSEDEIGELAIAFNEMTKALAEKEAAGQRLLQQVIRAGEEERKRIARELHDQTGQALTSLIAGLGALEYRDRQLPHSGRVTELRNQAEQALAEVHELAVALRPSVLDDVGLMPALQRHCRTFGKRFGVTVSCAEDGLGETRLPADVELTIYRLVQETLTNAIRHGHASRVAALVQRTSTGVLTTVQDDGCGFDSTEWQKQCLAGNHLGLLGMEERVTLLGGSFCVESAPQKGTVVYADIPLNESP